MKNKNLLLLLTSLLVLSGCNTTPTSDKDKTKPEGDGGSSPVTPSDPVEPSGPEDPADPPTPAQPTKHKVDAHTLKDNNVPFDNDSEPGQKVSESTWNSFKNGTASKFSNHYNFTYTAFYSASNYTQQLFTKNGYALFSMVNGKYYSIYRERKSGNTFYQYTSENGYVREEVTFNIVNEFTSVYLNEIKVHMSDYSDYTYLEGFELFQFDNSGASVSNIQFKAGYFSYSSYRIGSYYFNIDKTFDTEIEIPVTYYYE